MIEILRSSVKKYTHIIHVADIHIRLTKRHKEYREVFEKLYEDIKKSPETTLVCVLGDVCHSKSDLSPECVQMVADFLTNLSNLRDTILIPGNHDATLANKTRLDSLTPIVDSLEHQKLHYLKESKLYGIGNILFNHMSVFDDVEKYIHADTIPEFYTNKYDHLIALFHGPVDSCVTDTGFSISNPSILPGLFSGHDIALLGDIHKRQNIQEYVPEERKPCIHYPGSLIQQNHGEPLNPHGYTLWDLSNYNYSFKLVHNDYGYFTVEINKDEICTSLDDIPGKTYLRLKCIDAMPSDVKKVEAIISGKTNIVETSRIRIESEITKRAKETNVCENVKLSNIADVDYQNELITEYLNLKVNVTDKKIIDNILLINRTLNTEIKRDEFSRNLKWIPIRFEWDNMFTYGEDNYIDFTNIHGVYGIFGPNQCGKSSLFSALCFCLFDKWERGFKAVVVRNSAKNGFKCKFQFQISGTSYFIEKIGTTTKSGNVKVEVNFWKVENGKNVDLTDMMRRKTNDIIRDYVGTFEDFMLTTFSVQTTTKNNISFIDMGNTERKDLFVQFMGLNIFDRLYDLASSKAKELSDKLKVHKDKNYMIEYEEQEDALKISEENINRYQALIKDFSIQIRNINQEIVNESSKLIILEQDVPTDIDFLKSSRDNILNLFNNSQHQLKLENLKLEESEGGLKELLDQITQINVEKLFESYKKYKEMEVDLEKKNNSKKLKLVDITHKREKLKKLKEHKFDPNCKFCVENIFVKDAIKTEQQLKLDEKDLEELISKITKLTTEMKNEEWSILLYEKYKELESKKTSLSKTNSEIVTKCLLIEKDIQRYSETLKDKESKIQLYYKHKLNVDSNNKQNIIIKELKNSLNKLEINLNDINKKLLENSGKKEVTKNKMQMLKTTMVDMVKVENDRRLYDYYSQAVGRNGIPYQVICNMTPEITKEVNSILTQLSNITLEIESDEKNIVPFINHETKGKWPIEMTSGFERFVVSIAIRVAMCNISNLPRTSFLIIDEGFGSLDSTNLPSMHTLFTYLRGHFDFIFIVSHLYSLRDLVDKQIEITNIGDFSRVTFE